MTRIMYDSVTWGEIPPGARAVALYLDGGFRNWRFRWRFRKASKLSIAVSAGDAAAALDVEPGNATPAQAPAWVRRQLARKPKIRPVLYASRDNMLTVLAELRAAGINRDQVRLWSAHYGLGPHICSPRSCGAGFTADGTQWTETALTRNLDESLLADDFFPAKPKRKKKIRAPKPKPPKKVHKKTAGAGAAAAIGTALLAIAHAFGAHITPGESGAITALAALLGGYAAPPGYIAKKT